MSNTHVDSGPRLPPIASALMGTLAENWWLLLLRGLAAIAFGVLAFFWPGLTLAALVYLWGAYAIVDGVIGGVQRFGRRRRPALVARAERCGQHSRRYRCVRLYGHDGAGAPRVHRGMGDPHRRVAALRRDPIAGSPRQRMVVDFERSARDRFRRRADRLAGNRSAGGYLDDRLVRGLLRMHAYRAGVRAEEIQAKLAACCRQR